MTEPLLIPPAEAAAALGVSRAMLYVMAADGRLGPRAVGFGRRRLYRAAELRAWVAHDPPCPPRAEWVKEGRP